MKAKRIMTTAALALLSAGVLSSCDYSNFSLFGFFYNIYENALEDSYKNKDGDADGDADDKKTTGPTEAYRVTSSEATDSGTIKTTQQLSLLPDNNYSLIYYQRLVKSDNTESTYLSYGMCGKYERTGNVVTLAYAPSTLTDRSKVNTTYINGSSDVLRKEAFKKIYNSDTASFVVKTDGTFELGTSDSSTDTATGLSTANTYFYLDTVGRTSYKMISLLDDTNYLALNFSLDSKNQDSPVSNFVVYGTYSRFDDKKTDDYEVIKIGMGRGHMYASNSGSDMEFDITTDDSFSQWWSMSIGSVRTMKITKTGYTNSLGDEIGAYSFEILDEDITTDDDNPTPEKEVLLALEGLKSKDITLTLYKDHTYTFAYAAYKTEESGTWAYDSATDTLNLTCGETVQKFTKNEEGTAYSINYVYTQSDQLSQGYEIAADKWNSLFRVLLALKGDRSEKITLDLYADGSYIFAYAEYKTEESGTWTYDEKKDVLTLTFDSDHVYTSTKNADGTHTISYVYSKSDQLSQSFTLAKATWDKTFARTLATLKGLKKDTITLAIHSDNTYTFAYTDYKKEESGTWAYDETKDTITFTLEDTVNTTTKNADGTYALNYVSHMSAQLNQEYQIDKENWNALIGKSLLTLAGQNVAETTMTFNADNTYDFHYVVQNGQYEGHELGGWSYDSTSDTVTLTSGTKTNTLSKQADGSYKLSYVAAANSALTQDFVTYEQAFRSTFKHAEATCTLSKESQVNPYFNFYSDGSYEFGFATYKSSEKGVWSYDETEDKINLTCYGKTNSFEKQSDGTYTCNYVSNLNSSMSFDHFILSEASAATLLNKTAVEILKNNERTKFSFSFYKNHKYKFSFITYGVNEYGNWSYDATKDEFTFVCNNTTNTATKQSDGTYTFNYISNRSSSMTQEFTLPATDAATLIALA